jgi:hypothetical protein
MPRANAPLSVEGRRLAGLLLGGVGSGLVNPPLASTAVGVVHHHQAGMASGANTTVRQIGIAVGIAVYGSIFTAGLHHGVSDGLGERGAYAHALNEILVVSGCVAVVGGLLAVVLIRPKDFAVALQTPQATPAEATH